MPRERAYAQGKGGVLMPKGILMPKKGLRIPRAFRRAYAQEGAYAQRNDLRIDPDACGCSTGRDCVRFVLRFSRDTKNPQPFWRAPDVQPLCPGRGLMPRGGVLIPKGVLMPKRLMPKEAYAQGGAYAQKAYAQRLMPRVELMPK